MVLDLPKLNVVNAFGKFDKKLESYKNLENRELDPRVEDYDMDTESAEKFLDVYQVTKNVIIARESYKSHVVPIHSEDVIMSPSEWRENKSHYYLFKDGKPVTDPNKIKKTIKETMGVEIPSLSVGGSFSFGGGIHYPVMEFVTSVEVDKRRPHTTYEEDQPDEMEVADQLKDAKSILSDLAEEFGFENERALINNMKNLRSSINTENKKYGSIEERYRSIQEKAKKFDELVERAHRKKYGPRENVSLRLLADSLKGDVRRAREVERRSDRRRD